MFLAKATVLEGGGEFSSSSPYKENRFIRQSRYNFFDYPRLCLWQGAGFASEVRDSVGK
jgi:hypothetical protein